MPNFAKLLIDDDKQYFINVLDLILKIEKEQDKKYDKEFNKYEKENPRPDVTGYGWQDHMSDFAYVQDKTIKIMYKSFVVSIVMFMESKLLELCEHLKKEFGHKFSVYDLKRTGITRSIKYLKILGIDFPKNKDIKEDFELAFRIRNNLVHSDGRINDEEEKLKILGNNKKNQPKINVRNNELDFTEDYLKGLIELNSKVCDEISDNWLIKNFP